MFVFVNLERMHGGNHVIKRSGFILLIFELRKYGLCFKYFVVNISLFALPGVVVFIEVSEIKLSFN